MNLKKNIISTGLFTAVNLIASSVTLLLLPLHTHFLTPEEYGIFVTMSAVTTFLLAFNSLGIKGAALRYLSDTKAFDNKKYLRSLLSTLFTCAILFSVAFLILSFIVLYIISFTDSWEVWFYYAIFAILQATLMSPVLLYSEYLRVFLKNKQFLTLHLIIIIMMVVGNLLLVAYLKIGVLGVFISILFPYAVGVFLCLYWIIKEGYVYDRKMVWPLTRFGLNMLPHVIFSTLLPIVDRYIIVSLEGLKEVGFYAVINSICTVLYIICVNIGVTTRSIIYRLIEQGKYQSVQLLIQRCSVGLAVIASLWVLWAQEILKLLLPNSFYSGYDLVTILTLRFLLHIGPTFYLSGVLYHKEGSRKVSRLSFISLVSVVCLGYLFTLYYGVMGMAIGGAVSAYLYLALSCDQAKKMDNNTGWQAMDSLSPIIYIYAPIAIFIYTQGWQDNINISTVGVKVLLSLSIIGVAYIVLRFRYNKESNAI